MIEGGEHFGWDLLVPHVVHPLKVAIVEAMWWIGEPLSAADLKKVFDGAHGLSHIVYHQKKLVEAGALELVRERPVRGAIEHFYFFAA